MGFIFYMMILLAALWPQTETGLPADRELKPGESHAYRIKLRAGQCLQAAVQQRGAQIVMEVKSPDGQSIMQLNANEDEQGEQTIYAIAATDGDYTLELRLAKIVRTPSRYRARIAEIRAATDNDKLLIAAQQTFAQAAQLRATRTKESLEQALAGFQAALAQWRAAKNETMVAMTHYFIGRVYNEQGENKKAIESYQQALPHWTAIKYETWLSKLNNSIGVCYNEMSDNQRALEHYQRALGHAQTSGNKEVTLQVINNIGRVYADRAEFRTALEYYNQALALAQGLNPLYEASLRINSGNGYRTYGDFQKALDNYTRALAIVREIGERRIEGVALNNIGLIYQDLDEREKALSFYKDALQLRRTIGDPRGEASTLTNIGLIYHLQDEYEKALESYNLALELQRKIKDRRGESNTLDNIGFSYLATGDYRKTLEYCQQALTIQRELSSRYTELSTLDHIGNAYLRLGDLPNARDYFNQELALSRTLKAISREMIALNNVAQVEGRSGNYGAALQRAESAVKIAEQLRAKFTAQEFRAAFTATLSDVYETNIGLLMQLHKEQPRADYARRAFAVSERARARSLLELLAESRTEIRQGVDSALLAREQDLQQLLNDKADRLIRLKTARAAEAQITEVEAEIDKLTAQFQQLQAEIRRKSPRYAALTQPVPLDLAEIQQQVLDEETLLLEYSLGAERSYLWVVSRHDFQSYELPGRAEIEAAAQRVYELLTVRNRRHKTAAERQQELTTADTRYQEAAAALSNLILAPVAAQLEKRRMLLVADGALHYVPFGALPLPNSKGAPATPLVAACELVNLPSASTLALIRQERASRKPAARSIAVLADPVFDSRDPRIKKPAGSGELAEARVQNGLERATRDIGSDDFQLTRLFSTREEAAAVISYVPAAERKVALGFEASKAIATSAELGQYRIIHLASHGLLNSRNPELSGIVLSLVNEAGQSQDGFVRLHDIYNLNLPAELVVLSACQTGLGKEVRGEGLIGLTRGFMYAGAARVVASLWKVDDEATAELMKRFYEEMLKKGRKPASALRAAQLSMMQQRRWRAPFYWAAFTIQGDNN